jgi:hypothetical protein
VRATLLMIFEGSDHDADRGCRRAIVSTRQFHVTDAPTWATHTRAKVRTFVFTFGIAFTLLYTVLERLNWPLFTYQPAAGKLYFWLHRPLSGEGPPMLLVWLDRKRRHRRARTGLDRYYYFRSVAPVERPFSVAPWLRSGRPHSPH